MKKKHKKNNAFLEHLGNSLRERRIELLLSQEEVGSLAQLHRSYVTEVENGLRNISMTTYLRLSWALKSNPSSHIVAAEYVIENQKKT